MLDAQLAPIGFTYQQGAEENSIQLFNSKTQNDLTLELYNAQRQLVGRADNFGAGGNEELAGVRLTAGGQYFVRISGNRDAAQLYQLDLTVSAPPSKDTIDFREYAIKAYGGRQDHSGSTAIEKGGAALHLIGNRWKMIDFPYAVTANTVLEFDFASTRPGDIHGIGFDSNTSISSGLTFRLYGSQDWGISDFAVYNASSETYHFVIPVGRFYTGHATAIVFVNDHDVVSPSAESIFSNLRVYENQAGSPAKSGPHAVNDHIVLNEDSPTVAFDVLANDDDGGGAATLSVTGVSAGSAGGSVRVAADGRIHYRPAENYNGIEIFTYTAANDEGRSTATVTVTVRPVNDPPEASHDRYTVSSGGAYRLDVLKNDSTGVDAGESLTIKSVGPGSAGGRSSPPTEVVSRISRQTVSLATRHSTTRLTTASQEATRRRPCSFASHH